MSTVKQPGWKPQQPPDPELCKVVRQMVTEAVYAHWSTYGESISLGAIWRVVHAKIANAKRLGQWKFSDWPGKRTVDRRVNEAASREFYEDGVPKIVCETSGHYRPNPELIG